MLTEVEGIRVGNATDLAARTGCTVVLFPEGTVASGEVRGAAPATREFELLAPDRIVDRVDAVVLSGGSAFGLAAANGVVRFVEESGGGFPTPAGRVPIVVGLSLFDLMCGDASVRPTAEDGYAAASRASAGPVEVGRVGAGTGAQTGWWRGQDNARDSGLGGAMVRSGDVAVAALFAVNAFGDIDDGTPVADRLARVGFVAGADGEAPNPFGQTTIGVIATNARLDKIGCLVLAQGGHDGLARAIVPAHSRVDGDAIVAAATGSLEQEIPVDDLRLLAVAAVEQAIRAAAP